MIQSYSMQGRRESNEDQHISILNMNNINKILNPIDFVGVFDGHGGKIVSKYLKMNVAKYIMKKSNVNIYEQTTQVTSSFFGKLFDKLQTDLIKTHPVAVNRCGSTALCGIIYDDKKNKNLWIVNVGDSRAIMLNSKNKTIQLSKDHKPHHISEKKRIEMLGGKIKFDGVDWRVGDLSLSRSVGDIDNTPYVTHKPEIFKYKLNKKDKFIIFACDGLWDVVNNNEATELVNKLYENKYSGNIAKKLAEYAYKKGSYDNITVIILFLNNM